MKYAVPMHEIFIVALFPDHYILQTTESWAWLGNEAIPSTSTTILLGP